ncbi:hypothetical protein F5884DRAFT_860107 [Xylogone sp. PMI_703]|nr:hypothetical protein F5884DRAFT_860107 [Xylogone sp. PMI_703]
MGDADREMEIQDEIGDVVCEAGLSLFKKLAPHKHDIYPANLDSLLNPEAFYFQLITVDGRSQIVKSEDEVQETQQFILQILDSSLPRFCAKDIQVLKRFRANFIAKVVVEQKERCCKIAGRITRKAVQREFDCLSRTSSVDLGARRLRVPKLVGLVTSRTGAIIGILEEFICSNPCTQRSTLRGIEINTVPHALRSKWASQIKETVEMLHEIGVVWGDGKADNVLIDVNDDAWLIDFGGGWTDEWVDEKLAETIEGDKQAVQKIARLLGE